MSFFLTTTSAAVIEAVERNREGAKDLRERAHDWAEERGFDVVIMSSWPGVVFVRGLPGQPEGFGRWTQPKSGTSQPYRNNEAEWDLLSALKFRTEAIPGLPNEVSSISAEDGRNYLMWPQPFIHEGAAWVKYQHQLEPADQVKIDSSIWSECLASQYYAAQEGFLR